MDKHHKINYVEFPTSNIAETKSFFHDVFGWTFIDYGEDYCSVENAAVDAGFYQSDNNMSVAKGSALIVVYSNNLAASCAKVKQFGGKICKPIFDFPGGRRFHFNAPDGNEFAVWSDK